MDKTTQERTKAANAHISKVILGYMAAGLTLAQAVDRVLGPGAYGCLVSDLYDGLRAR